MTAREKFNLRARQQRIKKEKECQIPAGYVSVREFAAERDLAESGIFAAIQKGKLPSVKVRGFRCIRPEDYDEYRKKSTENRAAGAAYAHTVRSKKAKERHNA